jgi:hypothetical protein
MSLCRAQKTAVYKYLKQVMTVKRYGRFAEQPVCLNAGQMGATAGLIIP